MEIKGKRVLVTGGAVRIGRAISLAFAEEGAQVFIHYKESAAAARKLLREIGGARNGHKIVRCDLFVQKNIAGVFSKNYPIDILINNASVFRPAPLLGEPADDAMLQFKINFWAPLRLMSEFARQKISPGCIINILDQRISKTGFGDGSYSLSKKLLAEATLSAALELAPSKRVNAVAPGAVLPPRGQEHLDMRKHIAGMPLKKAPLPENIAEACIFLAKQDSITGQIIYVDGGEHLL